MVRVRRNDRGGDFCRAVAARARHARHARRQRCCGLPRPARRDRTRSRDRPDRRRPGGGSAVREADLGESLMAQANGVVTDDAKAAFERALEHDAKSLKARFFLAVAAHQDGQTEKAADIWRDMLTDARPDSPWFGVVREAL